MFKDSDIEKSLLVGNRTKKLYLIAINLAFSFRYDWFYINNLPAS